MRMSTSEGACSAADYVLEVNTPGEKAAQTKRNCWLIDPKYFHFVSFSLFLARLTWTTPSPLLARPLVNSTPRWMLWMKVTLQVLFGFILRLTLVNVIIIKGRLWDDESELDKDTDCDRVKAFYKEKHGEYHS
jgi:hypothetical protein